MKTIDDILSEVATESAPVFCQSYAQAGYDLSGGTARTITPQANTIQSSIAVHTLIWGRAPGKYPPFGYDRDGSGPTSLMRWCMNTFAQTEREAQGTSFAIARKLAELGNRVHQGLKMPIETDPTLEAANRIMFEKLIGNITEIIQK